MNVRNITSCPTKLDVFRNRGRSLGCSVGNEYHCMLDEKKHHVELCISRSWIQPDHCPEYNTAANRIDVSSCDASEGVCPPTIYWSNTSFLYSGCFRNSRTADANDPQKEIKDVLLPVVISVIVLLLVILCVVLLCRKKRRPKSKRGDDELENMALLPSISVSPEQLEKGREIIEEHRNDETYVPINAVMEGKKILNEKKILIIKGVTGSGKTKTALQIASEWMREDETGRKCIYLSSIDDHGMLNVNDNTCIVFDDCFTRWALDSSSPFIPEFCLRLHKQLKGNENMFLIVTIKDIIYSSHRQMLQKYLLFSRDHEINLIYPDYEERKKILKSIHDNFFDEMIDPSEGTTKQIRRPELTENKLKELLSECTTEVGFPSVCWMYTNIRECDKKGDAFFRACEYKLAKMIKKMKNPLKCCLHYAFLKTKNYFVDTNILDQECLKELRDIFGYKEMTDNLIQDCFKKERNYFSAGQNPGICSFSQSILYDVCLKEWIREGRRDKFLVLCNKEQVKENIRDETYNFARGDSILKLKMSEYSKFVPKFVSLLKEHKELEHHPLLQNEKFRKLKEEELSKQEKEELAKQEKEERAQQENEQCAKQENEQLAKIEQDTQEETDQRSIHTKGARAKQEEEKRSKQEKKYCAKHEKEDHAKQAIEERTQHENQQSEKQKKEQHAKKEKEQNMQEEKDQRTLQEKEDRAEQGRDKCAKQGREDRAKLKKEERAEQEKDLRDKQGKEERTKQEKEDHVNQGK